MVSSIEASGAQIITVAIRRLDLDNLDEKNILDYFNWDKYQILPNTAGCKTAEEAIFTAHLAREVTGSDWIKLEVIPYAEHLLPDPIGTYEAARQLVDEGYTVLPYIHADAVLAMKLEELGCATVMPLGSTIGSGQGVQTLDEIKIFASPKGNFATGGPATTSDTMITMNNTAGIAATGGLIKIGDELVG